MEEKGAAGRASLWVCKGEAEGRILALPSCPGLLLITGLGCLWRVWVVPTPCDSALVAPEGSSVVMQMLAMAMIVIGTP